MTLLNIFHSGELLPVLTGLLIVAEILLIRTTVKLHKSEYGRNNPHTSRWERIADKTPYTVIWSFWGAIIILAAYIIAMFVIASDYKGV